MISCFKYYIFINHQMIGISFGAYKHTLNLPRLIASSKLEFAQMGNSKFKDDIIKLQVKCLSGGIAKTWSFDINI
jgi:hypothetical protein